MRKLRGFTLIELLVVISIISILSAVIVVSVNGARVKARDTKRKSDLKTIQTALEAYYYKNNSNYIKGKFLSFSTSGATAWSSATGLPLLVPTYLPSLPSDPINKQNVPVMMNLTPFNNYGYYYYSGDGNSYYLGTNLEQGGGSLTCGGNYYLKGGPSPTCVN